VFSAIRKAVLALHHALVVLAELLIVAMVLITFTNVILRYFFDSGLDWAEEVSLMFVVWFTFIAMAIGVRQKLHISINIFPKHMPRWFKAFISRFDNLPTILVSIVMVVSGWGLVQFTMRSILPATGIPGGIKYGAVPLAGFLITFHAVADLFGLGEKLGGAEGEPPTTTGEVEGGPDA
jgi:TRAP-type C4-dicarboxylate transport system permease small subunit